MTSLSDERIKELYAIFDEGRQPGWQSWLAESIAHLEWAQALTDAELADPATQQELWSRPGLGRTGATENLSIIGLPGDAELTRLFLQLRHEALPPEPTPRAEHLEALHSAILSRVQAVLPGNTPRARLRRVMLSLRPAEGHAGFSENSNHDVRALLVGRRTSGLIDASCLARARLREVLGREADLRDHALRSIFCWWLHEKRTEIQSGSTTFVQPPTSEPTHRNQSFRGAGLARSFNFIPAREHFQAKPDEVHVWPVMWQHPPVDPGNTSLESIREHLSACSEPITFDALQSRIRTSLGGEFAAVGPLRRLLRLLHELDLIEIRDTSCAATPAGLTVLEDGEASALIEALLKRVLGFVKVLLALPRTRSRPHTDEPPFPPPASQLQPVPGDSSPTPPADQHDLSQEEVRFVLSWGALVGLVDLTDGAPRLSPLGERWTANTVQSGSLRSQQRRNLPCHRSGLEKLFSTGRMAAPPIPEPTLAELRALFQNDAQTANLVFPPELLRGLYAAWSFHARKRFVLLSGLSGTGKTALLQHTARLSCAHMGLDPAEHVALVAVGPDWRDPTALLGYWSALHAPPTFHAEAALRLVLRAVADPARPYFLLLDEMNLAPVERYLAPFLSAMESGADLQLHGEDDVVNGVPNKVCWPANLRIGGTVNMDETTYPFSDKVLDRAFTFEFWQVDLDGLFARRGQAGPTEARAQAALRAVQAHLEPIRRHVGYRALTEALDWIAACHAAEPEAPIAGLIDEAVFSKVLPRLRGSESSALSQALERVQETCRTHDLPRCAAKVSAMAGRLRDSGVTSFWS